MCGGVGWCGVVGYSPIAVSHQLLFWLKLGCDNISNFDHFLQCSSFSLSTLTISNGLYFVYYWPWWSKIVRSGFCDILLFLAFLWVSFTKVFAFEFMDTHTHTISWISVSMQLSVRSSFFWHTNTSSIHNISFVASWYLRFLLMTGGTISVCIQLSVHSSFFWHTNTQYILCFQLSV